MNNFFEDMNDDFLQDDFLQDDLSTADDLGAMDEPDLLSTGPGGSTPIFADNDPNSLFDDDDNDLVTAHHPAGDPVSFSGNAEDTQKQKEDKREREHREERRGRGTHRGRPRQGEYLQKLSYSW